MKLGVDASLADSEGPVRKRALQEPLSVNVKRVSGKVLERALASYFCRCRRDLKPIPGLLLIGWNGRHHGGDRTSRKMKGERDPTAARFEVVLAGPRAF
jgi:hypothetical protein